MFSIGMLGDISGGISTETSEEVFNNTEIAGTFVGGNFEGICDDTGISFFFARWRNFWKYPFKLFFKEFLEEFLIQSIEEFLSTSM